MLNKISSYIIIKHQGGHPKFTAVIENHKNVFLSKGVHIGKETTIRSRGREATIRIGSQTKIRDYVVIDAKKNILTISDYCYIARNCWIGGSGSIIIGTNSMVGLNSIIVSSDHNYLDIKKPYFDNSELEKPIAIGNNVWIGAGSIILGGSALGSGSVVAAGTVVKGIFPENSLIAGVPGKLKRTINR